MLVQPILSILGLPFELGRLWNAHFPCYKQILVMTSESTKGKHIFSLILLKTGNGPFGGEPISSLSESLLLLTSQEWSVTWGGKLPGSPITSWWHVGLRKLGVKGQARPALQTSLSHASVGCGRFPQPWASAEALLSPVPSLFFPC